MLSNSSHFNTTKKINVQRIAALWAFSEAVFGGFLHVLKFPFTGLFLGSVAVLFITIIAISSENKSAILHTTLLVLLVKAAVNPYSPVTVYLAITVQGIVGYLIFRTIRYKKLAALLLGFVALSFSAFQKIIILTILFGLNFWKSLDSFADSIFSLLSISHTSTSFSISMVLIGVYASLHILTGIYIGIKSIKINDWVLKKHQSVFEGKIDYNIEEDFFSKKKKGGKKFWWKKLSGIIVLIFLICLMIYSYLYPQTSKIPFYDVLFMIVRSIVITLFWFFLISPLILKFLKNFFYKKQYSNLKEIEDITSLFPFFNRIINYCWKNSSSEKGIKRFRKFFVDSFLLIIITDNNSKETVQ